MSSLHVYYIHQDRCKRCGRCMDVCPNDAISIPRGTGVTTSYGECTIDPAACDGCGLCATVCKIRAIGKRLRLFR